MQVLGKAASLPGRALAPTIARLHASGALSEGDHQQLAAFHSKVQNAT